MQKKAAAEGRARGGERAVRIDRKLGAIRGQAGEQRGRDRAREIAAERRCAEKKDFGLIGVDELRHAPRVGLVAVVGEDWACGEIGHIRAIGEGFGDRRLRLPRPVRRAPTAAS